jgi:hypothetical protein
MAGEKCKNLCCNFEAFRPMQCEGRAEGTPWEGKMNVHGWMESKGTPALDRVLHASETAVQPGAVAA